MDFGITRTWWWINSTDVNTAHAKNCDVTILLSHWTFRQWIVCILTAERHSEVTSTHERVIYDYWLWKPERVPQSGNFVRAGLTQLAMLSWTLCHVSARNQGSNSCVPSRPWLHCQLCLTAAVQLVLSARKVNMTVQPEHTSKTAADTPPYSVHSASKQLVMLDMWDSTYLKQSGYCTDHRPQQSSNPHYSTQCISVYCTLIIRNLRLQ